MYLCLRSHHQHRRIDKSRVHLAALLATIERESVQYRRDKERPIKSGIETVPFGNRLRRCRCPYGEYDPGGAVD
jgi:hypothetical protein